VWWPRAAGPRRPDNAQSRWGDVGQPAQVGRNVIEQGAVPAGIGVRAVPVRDVCHPGLPSPLGPPSARTRGRVNGSGNATSQAHREASRQTSKLSNTSAVSRRAISND
jgi:hypothetical protein